MMTLLVAMLIMVCRAPAPLKLAPALAPSLKQFLLVSLLELKHFHENV
jgi:hypothetical protein